MLLNSLALIYVSIAWGSAYVLIKFSEETIAPLTVQAGRCIIGFVAILLLTIILRRDIRGHAKNWFAFLVFALLGVVYLWITVAIGEKYISAGLATVMATVTPLVTFIITVFIIHTEKFSIVGVLGLLLGVLGLVLVVGIKNILGGSSILLGSLLIISGFAVFAVNGVIVPRLASGTDPLVSTAYYTGMASIVLWTLAFIFESPLETKLTIGNSAAEITMGVFSFASGFVVYYWLLNRAGAFFSSLTFYLLPIVGIAGSYLMFRDTVTVNQILGILIVFVGVYLINRAKFKESSG